MASSCNSNPGEVKTKGSWDSLASHSSTEGYLRLPVGPQSISDEITSILVHTGSKINFLNIRGFLMYMFMWGEVAVWRN